MKLFTEVHEITRFNFFFAPTLSPLSRQYLDQPFDWRD